MGTVYNGVMGLVVGDALGVPVEFKQRDTYTVTDMIGYGTHNQPPGTWSDDSSLALATLESLGRLGKIDPKNIMMNFLDWYQDGWFTPHGKVFDVGRATGRAIRRFQDGYKPSKCGGKTERDNGNGALMRILPVVFVPHTEADVWAVGQLTHAHEISQTSCSLYIHVAELLLKGASIQDAISSLSTLPSVTGMPAFSRIPHIGELSRDEIRSSGYVVDTLEAALWCLWGTDSYEKCVLKAVNLGDDTDTVGAVAGGLAGIYYGCGGKKGIPARWIGEIARAEWIKDLCEKIET